MRSAAETRPAGGRGELAAIPAWVGLAGLLLVALVVRLLFINATGFGADVSTFEAWSLTLVDHPMSDFYAKAGFADYPPGYFYVLTIVGHLYRAVFHDDPGFAILRALVKLPAIVCDLAIAGVLFGFVRARASLPWAYATAAAFAFDPAAIFISAYWGQVDSVAAAFALGGLVLIANANLRPSASAWRIVLAWLLVAYSILIKPPAIVLAPLFVGFCLTADVRAERLRRLGFTALGIVAAVVLAYLASIPFHPNLNPVDELAWLYARYRYAAGVYPYNSVNAFNLYVTGAQHFWQSDSTILPNWQIAGHTIGLAQSTWGIVLLAAAVLLVTGRYVQRRDATAIVEAAAILSLGYFVLSTRMHERYDFNADVLVIGLLWYRRRYAVAAVLLSITLFANLVYSLDYLHVMTAQIPGVDATNLMPWLSRPAAIVNVSTFFYLGYAYLGSEAVAPAGVTIGSRLPPIGAALGHGIARVRAWFAPGEGLAAMTRLDWALAGGFAAVSFALDWAWYWLPAEKIFDEIYYARAGEEYLRHVEIFEFTHPPLTKLIITGSMMLFGGLHGLGDTAYGWRFGNLVVGSLMVVVMYCFAKRLLGSTLFASVAAALLVFDGFHFVQSRIATPEITVAFFTLTTLYAFYRYWIAAQIRVAPLVDRRLATVEGVTIAIALALDGGITALFAAGQSLAAHVVLFIYLGCGAYALVRLVLPRLGRSRALVTYPDGTRALDGALLLPDGGYVPFDRPKDAIHAGLIGAVAGDGLTIGDGAVRLDYARDGALRYETPAGSSLATPDGTLRVGDARIDGRRDANIWFALLTISAGCLAASKWNGLFDFFVVWLVALAVVSQRWWSPALRAAGMRASVPRPARWGNPFGFSFDVLVTAMLFVAGSIYLLAYVPYFSLGHNLTDLVGLQQQMFIYHDQTVAHATHPYSSRWWQWPILEIPISYYYHDFRTGVAEMMGSGCCVAEVIAIPNPISWWLGVVSVPFMGWLAWRERNKGYALLFVAYFIQWLPWILSPRISFEYHFLPNLAIILMADAILLQRLWRLRPSLSSAARWTWNRIAVASFLVATLGAFVFWYPVLAAQHITYDAWHARMLVPLEDNNWINPHPGK